MLNQAPKWALRFLERTCSSNFLDELQGDLLELFEREITQLGLKKARKKFVWRVLGSLRWYRLPQIGQIQFIMLYKNYYKVAIRHAIKHQSSTTIHALGLMFGLAAAFYIGLYVKNEFLYDDMHEKRADLYRVLRVDPATGARNHSTSSNHGASFVETFPYLSMCRFGQDPVKIGDQNPILVDDFYWSDSTFFQLFNFEFIQGNPITCLDEINNLVITESLSNQLFGTSHSLGKSIKVKVYDGNQEFPMQITGVVKDPPKHTHIQFRALGAMDNARALYGNLLQGWYFSWVRTYIYDPTQRIAEVEASIPNLIKKYFGENPPPDFGIEFQPFEKVYLDSQDIPRNTFRGNIRNLQIFGAVGLLILLISLLNYVNLSTARAVTRSKEVGIRKVLGSQNSSIMGQFIVESTLFSLGSGIAGILLISILIPYLNQLLQLDLSLAILNWVDWLMVFGILIGLGMLAGILPAFVMAKLPAFSKNTTAIQFKVGEWSLTRKLFVGIQYFVTIALMVGTVVIYQQYRYLKTFDLGFDAEQLLHVAVDDRTVQEKMDLLKERLSKLNGVYGVSATGEDLPSELNNTWNIQWPGQEPDAPKGIDVIGVDQHYFELLGISFKEGKNFLKDYKTDSSASVILNEEALKMMQKESMVGQKIIVGSETRDVIGVVEDHHNRSLHSKVVPIAYFIFPPGLRVSSDNLLVKVEADQLSALLAQMEKVWKDFSSDPFDYNFVDEAFAKAYNKEQQFSALISSFTLIAIVISLIGLFGLINFIVQLKLKEIGIRRILGAGWGHLLQLLGKDFFIVFVIAAIFAVPIAYYFLSNWLESFAYRIQISGFLLIPAVLLCLGISALVIIYQLQRTTRIVPASIIKREN